MSVITILSGSPRKNGNTDMLVQAFARGASKQNTVEVVSVADSRVSPCSGCNYCYANSAHACSIKDAMGEVYEKLSHTDVLVIASPVYFYGISAELKAIVDRLHNPIRNTFKIKQAVLLSVAADTLPAVFDSIIMQYTLALRYFHLEDLGMVLVRGVEKKGDIDGNPALDEAYQLGLTIR